MVENIDIWRAAVQMQKMFGEDASLKSAMRADALLKQGDVEAFNVWTKIAAAITQLDRKSPDGEPFN